MALLFSHPQAGLPSPLHQGQLAVLYCPGEVRSVGTSLPHPCHCMASEGLGLLSLVHALRASSPAALPPGSALQWPRCGASSQESCSWLWLPTLPSWLWLPTLPREGVATTEGIFIGLLVFLLLCFKNYLYILDTNPLLNV